MSSGQEDDYDHQAESSGSVSKERIDDDQNESAFGTAEDSEKPGWNERYGGVVGKSDQDSIDQEKSALTDNFAQFASADHESLASSLSYLDQQLATLHSLRVMSPIASFSQRFAPNRS